ncbi:MAG: hypothetical protein WC847_00015 [Candidatus Paceibacterota bacterium]|jgi:hypoxanthine phosphoribosyltransferase
MNEKIPSYTRKVENVDEYVKNAKERVGEQASAIRELILNDKNIWKGESLKDHLDDCFNNSTGSISLNDSEIVTDFFKNGDRKDQEGENWKSRGKSYFVPLDPLRGSVEEKLDVILNDINDLAESLKVENIGWKEKAALLDYLKQHSLTLYHAIQYPKRFGLNLSEEHTQIIKDAEKIAVSAVNVFYEHLLGNQIKVDFLEELVELTKKINKLGLGVNQFKIAELDNPLMILANGYGNSIKYPDTECIIGLSSGGTQPAIVTKLCLEKRGGNPSLNFVPLSTHSTVKRVGGELTDKHLDDLITEINVEGKKVLISEDNSNTGKTITKISNAVTRGNPDSVNVSLVELDPWRVFIKSKGKTAEVTNELHPDFSTAVSTVPITRKFLPDRQIRKVAIQQVIYKGLTIDQSLVENKPMSIDYEKLPENPEFLRFKELYESALKKIGDDFGYRNPFMVAQELFKKVNSVKYLEYLGTQKERDILSSMATAATTYPFLPPVLKNKLENHAEIEEYNAGIDSPWIIEGATSLLDACFSAVKKNGGAVYFWTKGDNHRKGYEPTPGAHEQVLRYQISGLEKIIEELKRKYDMSERNFKFLAMPNKLRLISEVVCPQAGKIGAEIFLVEDALGNIIDSKKISEEMGVTFNSFLINKGLKSKSIIDCRNMISNSSDPLPVIFVLDVDDTLLHEDFRKEHQPLNIFIQMKNLDLI